MKKLLCMMLTFGMIANCMVAIAERTDHQKTLLGILTSTAKSNETFEDAYYDEEHDAYVLIVKDEEISSELFEAICKTNPTFLEQKERICKENLCEYFMDWMDMFNIDIPVIIKHMTADDVLMMCMKDGVRYDYDVLAESGSPQNATEAGMMTVMLTMFENSFKAEDGIILQTDYNEETKEAYFRFVILSVDKKYMKTEAGKEFKEQMEREASASFYPLIKMKLEGNDIEGLSIIIELATSDRETIAISKDGKTME